MGCYGNRSSGSGLSSSSNTTSNATANGGGASSSTRDREREAMDPIAELLSQLSGVRRGLSGVSGASGLGSVLGLGALGSLGGALGSLGGMYYFLRIILNILFHKTKCLCNCSVDIAQTLRRCNVIYNDYVYLF